DQRRFAGRLLPLTPFVVQTDAHDVVGWAASLRGDRPHYAAARGPSSPQIAEGADSGDAGHSDRRTILDEAIGSAACAVKQDVRRRQHAQAAACRSKPLELVVGRN